MTMRSFLAAILVMTSGSAALAQGPAAPDNPQDKIVCEKGDPPSGSHIATKVCHTVAEWQEIHRTSADILDRMQRGASNANVAGH